MNDLQADCWVLGWQEGLKMSFIPETDSIKLLILDDVQFKRRIKDSPKRAEVCQQTSKFKVSEHRGAESTENLFRSPWSILHPQQAVPKKYLSSCFSQQ